MNVCVTLVIYQKSLHDAWSIKYKTFVSLRMDRSGLEAPH